MLLMTLIEAEVPHGSSKVAHSRDGSLRDHSCGSMVNVCPIQNSRLFAVADCCRAPDHVAGSGKSVLWYVRIARFLVVELTFGIIDQLLDHTRNQSGMRLRISSYGLLLLRLSRH
jgi:hypothetical protein